MHNGSMNRNVIVSCAVTGSGNTVGRHPAIPVTPEEIATASIEAAKAGAAIAHIHVREPDSGKPSRRVELYAEVVERIRDSDTDVIINLTTGMGGDLFLGPDENPLDLTSDTDLVGQVERMKHVEALLPEICSLDCGSFNYDEGNYVYVSSPGMLRLGAFSTSGTSRLRNSCLPKVCWTNRHCSRSVSASAGRRRPTREIS
jgi:uncharacterized protein (DUF849 family)